MNSFKLTVSDESEQMGDSFYFGFIFEGWFNDTRLFAMHPYLASADYDLLADAAANSKCFIVDWRPSGAETLIEVICDTTYFVVAKYDEGGEIRVMMPSSACVKAFREAAELVRKYCDRV